MARYILQNTVNVHADGQMILFKAGRIIDEANHPTDFINKLVAVGARLVPEDQTDSANAAIIVRHYESRGADPKTDANAQMPFAIDSGFRVFETIVQRDALFVRDRRVGIHAFVIETQSTYRLEDDLITWSLTGENSVVVANIATLAALDATNFNNGQEVYVQTVRDKFLLDTTSLTPDGITIVAVSGESRRWIRREIPHLVWQKQTQWQIDPQNTSGLANNENTGLPGSPIRSPGELARRTGKPLYTFPVDIEFLSNIDDNDPYVPRFTTPLAFPPNVLVRMSLQTTDATETLSAYQPEIPGTDYIIVTIPAKTWVQGDWYQVMSGPFALATTFVVLEDLGAGQARISAPYNSTFQSAVNLTNTTQVRRVTRGTAAAIPIDDFNGDLTLRGFDFVGLAYQGNFTLYEQCDFRSGFIPRDERVVCYGTIIRTFVFGDMANTYACAYLDCTMGGLKKMFSLETPWQDTATAINTATIGGTQYEFYGAVSSLQFFNSSNPIRIRNGDTWRVVGYIYGKGTTGIRYDISAGRLLAFDGCVFNLLGSGAEIVINGKTTLFPVDPTTGLPGVGVPCTQANLTAAYPGGFGRNMFDHEQPATGIFKQNI